MADSLSELTMHWSCVERRPLDTVREMDTSRVDGVKAPHNGTPSSHHNILILVEGDTTVEHVFSLDLDVAVGREGVDRRHDGEGERKTHVSVFWCETCYSTAAASDAARPQGCDLGQTCSVELLRMFQYFVSGRLEACQKVPADKNKL